MIKFLDLKAINDSYQPELSQAVQRVIDSGWYLLGNEVKAFEESYAYYTGTRNCIGVANGLDALRLILKAYIELGVMEEGDEVIVPANTYIASMLAITDNRLVPVLVEPDINTYQIDERLIEQHITPKTKAIMIVHLYGQCAYTPKIAELCLKYKLKLVEDNAQGHGCEMLIHDTYKKTGSLGDAAGHSFYPGKNLGCLGDGGAITTDDDELAKILRSLANYGSSKKYVFEYKGLNSRLDELQAAVLRVKLDSLDDDTSKRRLVARHYLEHIINPNIVLPVVSDWKSHVFHIFPIRSPHRDALQEYLTDKGVQTLIHYPIPPHKQTCFVQWNTRSYPLTERIHNEILSLPISPVMHAHEIRQIVELINLFSYK